ncbi:unnamed protein product [Closterium sp. Naga37s-1]|nr:unnamed protein product [Closterium sp. Naga37s-1]
MHFDSSRLSGRNFRSGKASTTHHCTALSHARISTSALPSSTPLGASRSQSVSLQAVAQRSCEPRILASARLVARADASSTDSARATPGDAAAADAAQPSDRRRARLAVFVSGGGSNFKAIHAACADGRVNGDVVVVVSDKPECGGWQYARASGIPTLAFPVNAKLPPSEQIGLSPDEVLAAMRSPLPQLPDKSAATTQLLTATPIPLPNPLSPTHFTAQAAALRGAGGHLKLLPASLHAVDYIVLAGYLKLLPASLVEAAATPVHEGPSSPHSPLVHTHPFPNSPTAQAARDAQHSASGVSEAAARCPGGSVSHSTASHETRRAAA